VRQLDLVTQAADSWTVMGSISAAVAALTTVVGLLVARSRKAPDDGTPDAPIGDGHLSEGRIADLSQALEEYMGLSYKMDLEQQTDAGKKTLWTPGYMRWAAREDALRDRIMLLLDPSKPEQARLMDARCAVTERPFERGVDRS
jgi:hypothetical protein